MEDGEIAGNTASYGGGVSVSSGTFTMDDGVISGNTAGNGGGVSVDYPGTFTMEDGEISGNTAGNGGGVFIDRIPFSDKIYHRDRGVFFIKKGGTIYGDTDTITGNGNVTNNTATSGNGHAVYTGNKRRNATAGPYVKLYAESYINSTWTYDGTGVDGINADTTANWDQ
jgi:hypothetical protein